MNRILKIKEIRKTLKSNNLSLGSWMQIPDIFVAEIFGNSGYQWVAIDLEHGPISPSTLPKLCLALELNNTLPLVRLADDNPKGCKQALDSGAGGVIVPMVKSAEQLLEVRNACRWPPSGTRGVGFSRANNFGGKFNDYLEEAQNPLLIAMIENKESILNLKDILSVDGLDAILIGPYDLSASLNCTGDFKNITFKRKMKEIIDISKSMKIPIGIHVVEPDKKELLKRINEGFKFIAYSIDSVMIRHSSKCPEL